MSGLIALLTAGSAGGATPQQIYRDLADNERLDRKYSRADLNRAFGAPTIVGYTKPARARTSPSRPDPVVPTVSADDGRSLPFTGLDLALFGVVGGPLLLIGASMRRVARMRPRETS